MSALGLVSLLRKIRRYIRERNPKTAFMANIHIYISIDSMLTTPFTSRTTGGFVGFIFKAFSPNHGCFAPEETVEFSFDWEKVTL